MARWDSYIASQRAVAALLESRGGRPSDYAEEGAAAALAAVDAEYAEELEGLLEEGLALVAQLTPRTADPAVEGWPPPRWICCSRVEDDGSDVYPTERLQSMELAESAETYDSAVRRVSIVAGALPDAGIYVDPHFGSTDLPPTGRVLDVDFDGLHLWVLAQSRLDLDTGLSRMDALADEGYTGLSIGLAPESAEVEGMAQLIHVAMVSEAGYPRIAALPSLIDQGFGAAALAATGWKPPAAQDAATTDSTSEATRAAAVVALKQRVKAAQEDQKMKRLLKTRTADPPADDKTAKDDEVVEVRAADLADLKGELSKLRADVADLKARADEPAKDDDEEPKDPPKDTATDDTDTDDKPAADEATDDEVEEVVEAAVRAGNIMPVKRRAATAALKGVTCTQLAAVRAAMGLHRGPVEVQAEGGDNIRINPKDPRFRAGGRNGDPQGIAIVTRAEQLARERASGQPVTNRMISAALAEILQQQEVA